MSDVCVSDCGRMRREQLTNRVHPAGRGRGMGIPTLSCNAVFEVYYKGASAHAAVGHRCGLGNLRVDIRATPPAA